MADVLIYADTLRTPELRHEVPVAIPDPFLYVERNDARHVVVSSLEVPRLEGLAFEVHPYEEFGLDELRRSGKSWLEVEDELLVRAVRGLGVTEAVVPGAFPVRLADGLRAAGVELRPDEQLFVERRRVKSEAELAGIRRAQAAAEAGMAAARDLLRRSEAGAGGLVVDGEPLTSELVKHAISQAFLANGASADEFVVSHGPQSAIGHHMGEGRIEPREPVVVDLWPRDNLSGCFADMTRTFVVGEASEELARWQRLSREALERSLEAVRAGVSARSVYDVACDVFEAAGFPTQRTKAEGQTLEEGFFYSLGHGVGLDVHELPVLGLLGRETLLAGEVFAVEPGLARPDLGGVRLEDLVLVTDDGVERLADFPYELAP